MALKPEDIPRPGVAQPDAAYARPTTVELPKINDPRGQAMAQTAEALSRQANATDALAARTRQAGQEIGGALQQKGRAQYEAGVQVADAQDTFAKTIGNISHVFDLLERNRQDAQDSAYIDRWQLEAAKSSEPIEADHLNSPGTGPEYIQSLDDKLAANNEEVTKKVSADLGYEPSPGAARRIADLGYSMRAESARRTAIAANNQRVDNLLTAAQSNVEDISREAGSTGDLATGMTRADASIETLRGVLPDNKLDAAHKAARNMVFKDVVLGHLQRGEIAKARQYVDAVTGFAGPNADDTTKAVIGAAQAEGVDPLVALGISYRETGGKFDPTIHTFIDPKTGKPASSASGLFQMTSATSRYYLGTADASGSPVADQALAGARLTADNVRGLRRVLGGEPTPGEVYLAHTLGLGRATQLLQADPTTPLRSILNDKEIANVAPGLKSKTVADLMLWSQDEMQKSMQAVVDKQIVAGRKIDPNLAGVPIDSAIELNKAVSTAEKQQIALAEKRTQEFGDAFLFTKPKADRDPAQYTLNYAPKVKQAFITAKAILADDNATDEQKAKAWTSALALGIQEQKDTARANGVTLSDANTKALPVQDAKELVARFTEANGPDAVKMFYKTRDLLGPLFPKVFGELVDQKLPPGYQLLSLLDPIKDPAQVNAVSQVLNRNPEEMKKALGDAAKTLDADLYAPLDTSLQDFKQAFLFAQGNKNQALDQVNALTSEAQKVALNYYLLTRDPGEAARRAAAIINDHVHVINSGNVTAPIPLDAGVTPGQVQAAADYLSRRTSIDSFDPINIGTPLSAAEQNAKINQLFAAGGPVGQAAGALYGMLGQQGPEEEFRRERTRSTAANFGKWVLNDRGDGLVLVVPFGNGISWQPLKGTNGPYEFKFADAPKLAANEQRAILATHRHTGPMEPK